MGRYGETLDFDTSPVIYQGGWASTASMRFQLLHQGTRLVPCDFIIADAQPLSWTATTKRWWPLLCQTGR